MDGTEFIDEAEFGGVRIVGEKAFAVLVVERIVDIRFKVELQLFFGQVHFRGRFFADGVKIIQTKLEGIEKFVGERFGDDFFARCPDCEDGGALGELPPFVNNVVDMERGELRHSHGGALAYQLSVSTGFCFCFRSDCEAKRGIADDEPGVGVREHGGDIGFGFSKFRRNIPSIGGENARESLRAAGTAIESDTFCEADRAARDDEEAADTFLGGDRKVRQDNEIWNALIFDGRDDGYVGGAGTKSLGALRRNGEEEIVFALQRAMGETPNEGSGVEVLHNGDAKFRQGWMARGKGL